MLTPKPLKELTENAKLHPAPARGGPGSAGRSGSFKVGKSTKDCKTGDAAGKPKLRPELSPPLKDELDSEVTAFIAENTPKLRGFILRYVKDQQTLEDIIQQTMMIAYRNFYSFRGESARSTWFLGIARNLIRNHFSRSPECNYSFVAQEALENTRSLGRTPEEDTATREMMQYVRKEIAKLPANLKEVLEMVVLRENSYKEVSDKLRVSIGTVRSRLSRARTRLRHGMQAGVVDSAEGRSPAKSVVRVSR